MFLGSNNSLCYVWRGGTKIEKEQVLRRNKYLGWDNGTAVLSFWIDSVVSGSQDNT